MPQQDTVIVAATRTPIGAFQGTLASVPAPQLGSTVIKGLLDASGVAPADVTDVLLGTVLTAGIGQAPARQAAIHAGLPTGTHCAGVNKVCGSGLETVLMAHRAIRLGEAKVVIAGGMESMSGAPYLLPKARAGFRLGHQEVIDSLVHDGLWDPYGNQHMGSCAEQAAARYGFSRADQDAFAVTSFQRAQAAQASGLFAQEITPVDVTDGRGRTTRVDQDEGPSRVNYDKVPTLRPAFAKDGTITAANASTLNDGAAGVLMMSAAEAAARGLMPLARIISGAVHSQEPLWFTTAPAPAAQAALKAAGWSTDDVDLWEINEAFALVPLAFMKDLGIAHEKVNVRGGAISLGHPIGASGARVLVTLLAALRERGLRRGVASLCIGGGEGIAAAVELLP